MIDNAKLELVIQPRERSHVQIERFVRSQIQSGKLLPGERLPATSNLARQWHVDCTTIQKAMTRLAEENLLDRIPNRGTFVKDTTRGVIGLLTSQDLKQEAAHFYRAMIRAVEKAIGEPVQPAESSEAAPSAGKRRNGVTQPPTGSPHWTTRIYDQLGSLEESRDPNRYPSYQRLVEDFANYPFKGWVEIGTPKEMFKTFDFGEAGKIPSVRHGPPNENTDVAFDMEHFGRETGAFLARRGCRRIVYLCGREVASRKADLKGLHAVTGASGLPAPLVVQWPPQKGGAALERAAFEIVLRLATEWQRKRIWPDGLLVSDDIAMCGVALALARYHGPRPVVVTLANEGVDLHYGLPVTRWETPIAEAAHALLERLRQRLAGQPVAAEPVLLKGQLKEEA